MFCNNLFFCLKRRDKVLKRLAYCAGQKCDGNSNLLQLSYPSNKSNALNQDVINFVINFQHNLVTLINY